MNNRWNRFIYALWSPVYDSVMTRLFTSGRKRAMKLANLKRGEKVVLLGVGTGIDLLHLPNGVEAVGVDLSQPMLRRAREKLPIPGRYIRLQTGDIQNLNTPNSSCDVVILNLILSVVPDANKCFSEALRILRPGGRIAVFDKFIQKEATPSWSRKLANLFTKAMGTDITRRLEDIIQNQPVQKIHDEASSLKGMYRVVILEKETTPPSPENT